MENKFFLITIDTEGDNQWDSSKEPTTENARFLPRFQELAEKYGFFPTWLTNYEMAQDPFFIEYMRDRQDSGKCEIGMHLHAWHNPPEYPLETRTDQRSYLIEYPESIMDEKIGYLTKLLEDTFQTKMLSHRSGRWALNSSYLRLLSKYGYKVDCSVTPFVDWRKSLGQTGTPGSDYSQCPIKPYIIGSGILEIPMTIRNMRCFNFDAVHSAHNFLAESKKMILGRAAWLRPSGTCSFSALKKVLDKASQDSNYVMFMLHSSEMMPGGSPSFPNANKIERMYSCVERLFEYAKERGYKGCLLKQFAKML